MVIRIILLMLFGVLTMTQTCIHDVQCSSGQICSESGTNKGTCVICEMGTSRGCTESSYSFCSNSNSQCVLCRDSNDCRNNVLMAVRDRKVCETGTYRCVSATKGVSCTSFTASTVCTSPSAYICSPNTCQFPASITDCANFSGKPYFSGFTCVTCTQDSHCTDSANPRCDKTRDKCSPCWNDADCSRTSFFPSKFCVQVTPSNPSTYKCSQCRANSDCLIQYTDGVCSSSYTCQGWIPCTSGSCTTSNWPICDSNNYCRRCQSDTECSGQSVNKRCKKPGTNTNTCVQCLGNTDCTSPGYTCRNDNTCKNTCSINSDCPSSAPECPSATSTCTACSTSSDECSTWYGAGYTCRGDKTCKNTCSINSDCPSSAQECRSGVCKDCSAGSDQCPTWYGAGYTCRNDKTCKNTCSTNLDCPSSAPECKTGVCKDCSAGSDQCPTWYGAGYTCSTTTKKCEFTGCTDNSGNNPCTQPDSPVCNSVTKACQKCTIKTDCNSITGYPECYVPASGGMNKCVKCFLDSHCNTASGEICQLSTFTCQIVSCTTSSSCVTGTPSHPECISSKCGKCSGDQQCKDLKGSTYYGCNTSTGKCEPTTQSCTTSANCPTNLPWCDTSVGHCFPCSQEVHCSAQLDGKTHCKTDSGTCVQCLDYNQCTDPSKSVCTNNACSACQVDGDCKLNGLTRCDNGVCRVCAQNSHCSSASQSKCNTNSWTCTPCSDKADCSHITSTTECGSGVCTTCSSSSECKTWYSNSAYSCDTSSGACFNCVPDCSVCANSTACGQCDDSFFLKAGQCVIDCGDGYFSNTQTKTCDICDSNCLTCKDTADYCTSCSSPYVLNNFKCQTSGAPPSMTLRSTSDPEVFLLEFSKTMQIQGDFKSNVQISLTNVDPADFTFKGIESQPTGKSFKVTFEFKRSIGVETLTLTVIDQRKVMDTQGLMIVQKSVQAQTVRFSFFSADEKASLQTMSGAGSAITTSAMASSGSLLLFGGGATFLISLLSIFQIINYLLFMNVNYPLNVVEFFKLFAIARFDFMPNPLEYITPGLYKEMEVSLAAPSKFIDYKMDGRFLNNSGSMVATWFFVGVLYLLTRIIMYIFRTYGNINKVLSTFRKQFEWGAVANTLMGSYAELILSVALQLNNMDFSTSLDRISSSLALVAALVCFLTPVLITEVIESLPDLKAPVYVEKFGSFYEDYVCEQTTEVTPEASYYKRNFLAFILLRKLVYLSALVLAYDIPLLQLTITTLSGLVLLCFMIKFRPYRRGHDKWINVGSELILFLIHLTVYIFAVDDITLKLSDSTRKNAGWIVVGLCSFLIVYNALFILVQQVKAFIKFGKLVIRTCQKKKKKSKAIANSNQVSIDRNNFMANTNISDNTNIAANNDNLDIHEARTDGDRIRRQKRIWSYARGSESRNMASRFKDISSPKLNDSANRRLKTPKSSSPTRLQITPG